jgi:PAS domain S-box-containing protein
MEQAASASEEIEVLSEAAHRITSLIGDGCVIRVPAPGSGSLRAVAADHRDEDRRKAFRSLLGAPPLGPPGDWPGQALQRGCAVRMPELGRVALAGAGVPFEERISDVVFIPVARRAVIAAIRDRIPGRYSALEREELESMAAEVGEALPSPAEPPVPEPLGPPPGVARPASGSLPDRGLLDSIAAGLWIVDSRGLTTYVNELASELVGVPADQLVGLPVAEFIDEPPPGQPADFFGQTPSDRRMVRADGSVVWIHAASRPLFGDAGHPAGAAITIFDIGERREREVSLRTRLDSERALTQFAELLLLEDAPERCLPRATRLIADQLDLPLVALATVSRDRREANVLAVAGALADADPDRWSGRHSLNERAPALAAARTAATITVADFDSQSTYRPGPLARAAGMSSVACAPIAGATGCLVVTSLEPGAIGRDEIALLESVARLISARISSL